MDKHRWQDIKREIKEEEDVPVLAVRLEEDEFEQYVDLDYNSSMQVKDNDGQHLHTRILRPRKHKKNYYDIYNSKGESNTPDHFTNVLMNCDKLATMWNEVFGLHRIDSPECTGFLNWHDQQKWGLCWSVKLKCTLCTFTSKRYKLYDEVETFKRGRKAARANVGLHIGLSRQGIGPAGISDILNAANVIAPSSSGLHKGSQRINPILIETNNEDISLRRKILRDMNVKRGLPENACVSVEADGTYNNRLQSGAGRTPFQPATQATFLVCENVTEKKQIISVGTHSRQCTCHKPINFIGKHESNCRCNVPYATPIGNEGAYLTEEIKNLNESGIYVNTLTIDGDSNTNIVASTLQQEGNQDLIRVQRCSRHLSRTLERELRSSRFSEGMFSSLGSNKFKRKLAQQQLSLDISKRCSAEFDALHKLYKNNHDEILDKLPLTAPAIIDCYSGNCEKCETYSFVCHGPNIGQWPRPFLNIGPFRNKRVLICPDEKDKEILLNCINVRLGTKSINSTIFNRTQNKCEAANRGISKALPKHLNFASSYPARVSSAVLSMNCGPGISLLKTAEKAGAPITPGSQVVQQLQKQDDMVHWHQKNKKSHAYKIQRSSLRRERYELHANLKLGTETQHKTYERGMADACFKSEEINTEVSASTSKASARASAPCRNASPLWSSKDHGYCLSPRQ